MKVQINKHAHKLITELFPEEDNQFKFWILNLIELFPIIDEFGFVRISSTYMKDVKRNYEKEIQKLLEKEIIRTNNKYKVDSHAKAYRINTYKITSKELINIELDDKFFKRDSLSITVENTLNRLKLDESVFNLLNSSKLKKQFGDQYINKITEPMEKIVLQRNQNNSRTKSNRLVNNFARMKSELRYYFTLDGERLIEVDAANSQLFFLNILILREQPELFKNQDAELFKQLSIKGEIYEYIEQCYKELYPKTDANRTIIKMSILQSYFASETDKNGKKSNFRRNTRKVFEKYFPTIYKFIVSFKQKDYKKLAIMLQKIESEFIDKLEQMMEDIIPVYDCVYIKETDIQKLKFNLTNIFHTEYGLIPKFKYKVLSPISVNKFIKRKKVKDNIKKQLNNNWY